MAIKQRAAYTVAAVLFALCVAFSGLAANASAGGAEAGREVANGTDDSAAAIDRSKSDNYLFPDFLAFWR